MAVFLVNQCTFAKLPNATNDQQTNAAAIVGSNQNGSNGPSQVVTGQQQPGIVPNAAVGMGLPSPNICGLKFDSLLELIHHIEDNHINDIDFQGISSVHPAYYNGHSQQPQQQMMQHHTSPHPSVPASPHHPQHMQSPHPMHPHLHQSQPHSHVPHQAHPQHHPHHHLPHHPQPHPQQQVYSENLRMQSIINGQWLPTSCVLRIFNSTHKPPQMKKELVGSDIPIGSPATPLYQQHPQTPTPQPPTSITHHQPLIPGPSPQGPSTPMQHPPQQMTPQPGTPHQPLSVEMMAPSPQICQPGTPMDTSNSHHIILASPKIMGNMYHGSPYHVTSGTMANPQQLSNMTSVTLAGSAVNQPMANGPQLINVNNSIQTQTIQLQPQQQLGNTIQLQPSQMHPHQMQQQVNIQSQPTTPQSNQQIMTQAQIQIQSPMGQMQPQLQSQMQAQMQPQMQAQMQQQMQSPMQQQMQSPMQAQLQSQIPMQGQMQQSMQPGQMQQQIHVSQPQQMQLSQIQIPNQQLQPQSQAQLQPMQIQPVQSQQQSQIPVSQTSQQQSTNSKPPAQKQQSGKTATDKIKCLECGRLYKTQKNFNIHMANNHGKNNGETIANTPMSQAPATPAAAATSPPTTTTSNTTIAPTTPLVIPKTEIGSPSKSTPTTVVTTLQPVILTPDQ